MTKAAAERMGKLRYAFVMQWQGETFPQGARIGQTPVGSIHGGVVLSASGERLALCEWLMTFDNSKQRQLVIATDAAEAFNPDGTRCRTVEIMEPPAENSGARKG